MGQERKRESRLGWSPDLDRPNDRIDTVPSAPTSEEDPQIYVMATNVGVGNRRGFLKAMATGVGGAALLGSCDTTPTDTETPSVLLDDVGIPRITGCGSQREGTIDAPGDSDWYSFNATQGRTYSFEVSAGTLQNLYLGVYGPNSQGTFVAQYGPSVDCHITLDLGPGTYYTKVWAPTGMTGTYTVRVDCPTGSACTCDLVCTCDGHCTCDGVCTCDGQQCYCDSVCACDGHCTCDGVCSCDGVCTCDGHCSCDTVCTCDAVCTCNPQGHYWYPN